MKEKWAAWPVYRRAMLLATAGILAIFAVLYPIANTQKGLVYGDDFYRVKTVDSAKVYIGVDHGQQNFYTSGINIRGGNGEGKKTAYTVSQTPEGYRMECQVEGESFGPYTLKTFPLEDFRAAPETATLADFAMRLDGGLEIIDVATGETLFRGGYGLRNTYTQLISETVTTEGDSANYMTVDGVKYFNYSPASPEEGPGPYDLVAFSLGAEEKALTHHGAGWAYLLGLLVAAINIVSIVWAEELFVWSMSFRVADPESVEPSGWEIFTRHVGWGLFLLMELIVLIMDLSSVA